MYIPRGVRYGTVRRYVLLVWVRYRYVLLGTGTVRVQYVGMARRYGVLVQFTHRTCFQTVPTSRTRTVPAPYPHRTSFTVLGHPIEHNS